MTLKYRGTFVNFSIQVTSVGIVQWWRTCYRMCTENH